jgi:hypothetical protein
MEAEQVEQGNIMRIDINMDDVSTMSALVAGLISMIRVKSGGIIPPELLGVIGTPTPTAQPQQQTKTPSPTTVVVNHNKLPPIFMPTDNKHNLMDAFIDRYCIYGDGQRIKSTDMRTKFNEYTRLNESHVSFSKLMDSYNGAGDIGKKQRADGKWYEGIGWKQAEHIYIPTINQQ